MPAYFTPRRRATGYTAIELLVAISVVAVLAALALPSYKSVIARYRVRTTVEDLKATLYFTRSEAFRRGGRVTLRKASAANCAAPADENWSCGWIVFSDDNGNGRLDQGEEPLQASRVPMGTRVFNSSKGVEFMTTTRWGEFNGIGAFGFKVVPADSTVAALNTVLCISAGGRLRTATGAASC